ncbi:hypothetical protein ACLB2K_012085 [Fragaria x ananassa]
MTARRASLLETAPEVPVSSRQAAVPRSPRPLTEVSAPPLLDPTSSIDIVTLRRTTVSPCPVRKANLKNPAGGVGALSILSRLIRSKRLSAPRYYNHYIPRPRGGTPATTKRDFARPDLLVGQNTTTVNYPFGGGVLSPSTGIVLNNEMGDFSIPTDITPDHLPPAPSNFIEPIKRPLSSMTPIIVTKDNQLVGVLGGSGGLNIIPAVTQVFINYFILGMEPLAAVQSPRVFS